MSTTSHPHYDTESLLAHEPGWIPFSISCFCQAFSHSNRKVRKEGIKVFSGKTKEKKAEKSSLTELYKRYITSDIHKLFHEFWAIFEVKANWPASWRFLLGLHLVLLCSPHNAVSKPLSMTAACKYTGALQVNYS